jgi:hypothetical protein
MEMVRLSTVQAVNLDVYVKSTTIVLFIKLQINFTFFIPSCPLLKAAAPSGQPAYRLTARMFF